MSFSYYPMVDGFSTIVLGFNGGAGLIGGGVLLFLAIGILLYKMRQARKRGPRASQDAQPLDPGSGPPDPWESWPLDPRFGPRPPTGRTS
jgi:hypothetical protein